MCSISERVKSPLQRDVVAWSHLNSNKSFRTVEIICIHMYTIYKPQTQINVFAIIFRVRFNR